MFGIFLKMVLVTDFGSILPKNIFFYDANIFTPENICHYVKQMSLNDMFFGCDIWTEPSKNVKTTYFGSKKMVVINMLASTLNDATWWHSF